MRGFNKVIVAGYLGADPSVYNFENGGKKVSISIATSESWVDRDTGEKKESTEWHKVSLFNKLADVAEKYLKKGDLVFIEGSMHYKNYQDVSGKYHIRSEIRAKSMQMMNSKSENGKVSGVDNNNTNQQKTSSEGAPSDDLDDFDADDLLDRK